jgi:hypothetical protein
MLKFCADKTCQKKDSCRRYTADIAMTASAGPKVIRINPSLRHVSENGNQNCNNYISTLGNIHETNH